MTVPGVRVTSVRRTVRVAVALVIGQALLGGLIGIVTFAGGAASRPGASAAGPQLAGPPVVVPTPGPPPPSPPPGAPTAGAPTERPEPGTVRSGRMRWPTSSTAPVAVRTSATRTIGPAPTTSAPRVRSPAPTTSSPDSALVPPPLPAPEGDTPAPVVEQDRCADEGAIGWTVTGELVRCERDRRGDGELRWRRV